MLVLTPFYIDPKYEIEMNKINVFPIRLPFMTDRNKPYCFGEPQIKNAGAKLGALVFDGNFRQDACHCPVHCDRMMYDYTTDTSNDRTDETCRVRVSVSNLLMIHTFTTL